MNLANGSAGWFCPVPISHAESLPMIPKQVQTELARMQDGRGMRPRGTGERRGAVGQRGEGNNLNDGNSDRQNGIQGGVSQKNGGNKFDPNDQGSSSGEPPAIHCWK